MKTALTILFAIYFGTGFTQTNPDNLQLQKSDSTGMFILPDSLSPQFFLPKSPNLNPTSYKPSVYLSVFIPHCTDLIKRDELFYFDQDSLPYCGYCAVLQNGEKSSLTYYEYTYSPTSLYTETFRSSRWNGGYFVNENGTKVNKIKIISSYTYGQRDGQREYYDINGKLYKIEIYKNGKLLSTDYID